MMTCEYDLVKRLPSWKLVALATAALVVWSGSVLAGEPTAPSAAAATNSSKINGRYVIDVRTQGEWDSGHVEGAILIPYDQIDKRISEVTTDRKAPIALYCRSGRRSGIALKKLQEMGYENVVNLGSLQQARNQLSQSAQGQDKSSP